MILAQGNKFQKNFIIGVVALIMAKNGSIYLEPVVKI